MDPGTGAPASSAVVLQHQDDAPGGVLIDVLAAAGFSSSTVRVDLGEPLPDPGPIGLAVTLGRDGTVDGSGAEWLETEVGWLRQADRSRPDRGSRGRRT